MILSVNAEHSINGQVNGRFSNSKTENSIINY